MAEWSARWTHNLAVPGSNPAMITCWILVCSKRSDSGERCEVKKAMKSRGGLGALPLPRFYFFALLFTSHRSPLSERLEQAKQCWELLHPFARSSF